MSILIGSREVGPGHPCLIVAESGINHNGSADTALEMVRAAKRAGADAFKVAAITASDFCTASATYKGESQLEMFRRYELSRDDFRRIADECARVGLIFFGTPTSVEWARFLVQELGAPCVKIGSDDIVDHELIRGVAGLGVPVIISTGMAERHEIESACEAVFNGWPEDDGVAALENCVLMHCVSLYPTWDDDANVQRMETIRPQHSDVIGYSDHTTDAFAAIVAVSLGANIVEKHLTLDRRWDGPDHWFSADESAFSNYVSDIRRVGRVLGHGRLSPSVDEMLMRRTARRSIVADRPCTVDTVITMDTLAFKRTGTAGILPYDADKLIGKRLRRDIAADEPITLEDVE